MGHDTSRQQALFRLAGVRFVAGLLFVALLYSLSAGTLAHWELFAYLAALFLPMLGALVWLVRNEPALLERRLRLREREPGQPVVLGAATALFLLLFVVPGLDRRFGWSGVPVPLVILADLVVLAGYTLFFLVLRTNRYAGRTVQVDAGQQLITTGPYGVVRHPMYLATTLIVLPTPIALGSYWGTLLSALIFPLLVVRIRLEEATLARDLLGYEEYAKRVRYRLIPGIW